MQTPSCSRDRSRFTTAAYAVAIVFSSFQIVTAAFSPLSSGVVRAVHVGFLLLMTFVLMPPLGRRWLGWVVGGSRFAIELVSLDLRGGVDPARGGADGLGHGRLASLDCAGVRGDAARMGIACR